ncbi:MAG TPA: radical SAM protein [Bacteroidales bacterium]|nr:radical SAM protein [Bacteroidales bacterium]HRZ76183.1 radical SAM protein [Bacteroidales bacterium]
MSLLFHEMVFGPVKSRRLGVSLGINLLPSSYKYCSFDCIYCECGWGRRSHKDNEALPSREAVIAALESRLAELSASRHFPDAITFAGNGEPTIHPGFARIIEDTRRLRDQYMPETAIGVLSNASMLHKPEVMDALRSIELNMLKLDAGTEETFRRINQPPSRLTLEILLDQMKQMEGNLIIQSIFLRGEYQEKRIDNTSDAEVEAWIRCVKEVNPQYAMIYSIDRSTPVDTLEKVGFDELLGIAARAEAQGVRVKVYG